MDIVPLIFCLAVFCWSNTCTKHANTRTKLKSMVKYGQNHRKLQNLLEVQEWHENKSVGQVRGENETHDVFVPC